MQVLLGHTKSKRHILVQLNGLFNIIMINFRLKFFLFCYQPDDPVCCCSVLMCLHLYIIRLSMGKCVHGAPQYAD